MTSSFSRPDLPHSSVLLLGNPSEARTEGKGGDRRDIRRRERNFRGEGALTRHLSIHLVLHVWGWRATTDHTLRRHVVAMRRLRGGSTLVHPTRAHGHVLSGRLQAHNIEQKRKKKKTSAGEKHIGYCATHSQKKQIRAKISKY